MVANKTIHSQISDLNQARMKKVTELMREYDTAGFIVAHAVLQWT